MSASCKRTLPSLAQFKDFMKQAGLSPEEADILIDRGYLALLQHRGQLAAATRRH